MQYSIIQNIVSELDTMLRCTEQILELVCLFFVYKHVLFTIRFMLITVIKFITYIAVMHILSPVWRVTPSHIWMPNRLPILLHCQVSCLYSKPPFTFATYV